MRLTLTVHVPGRRAHAVDVDVLATPGQTVRDLKPALLAAVPDAASQGAADLCIGETPLDDDHPIGHPPLVHGASLVSGPPASLPDPHRSLVELVVVSGPDAGRSAPVSGTSLTVGRSRLSDLTVDDPDLSRSHVRLDLTGDRLEVSDAGSTNGVEVDGRVVDDASDLTIGATIEVGSSQLRLRRRSATPARLEPDGEGRVLVRRAPRVESRSEPASIQVPQRPSKPHRTRVPWVAALIPVPIAAVMAVFWGPQMMLFALLGPVMMLGTAVSDRVAGRRGYEEELAAYETDVEELRDELAKALVIERRRRERSAPDLGEVLTIAATPSTRLWERSPGDDDWGSVRVGRGTLPALTRWVEPAGRPGDPVLLTSAPVTVSLRDGGLGVVASVQGAAPALRAVIGQLAALHSPDDLVLWCLAPSDDWGWLSYLPHTALLTDATDEEAVSTMVAEVAQALTGRDPRERSTCLPRHLVVAPGGVPTALARLLEQHAATGLTCLVSGARGDLPTACRAVLDLTPPEGPSLVVDDIAPLDDLVVDGAGSWWAERLARRLAPLRDGGTGDRSVIPAAVTLIDLLGLDIDDAGSLQCSVADRWRVGDAAPVATLGHAGSGPWTIDLRSDGPHALIGGTTGAGKSELLQTLVASLALSCAPTDLTFVLVDYKGGSAFGACAALPHTVGVVTDLDEHLTERALTSLAAELKRRERVLAAVGAKDIEDYRRRRSKDDPRLARLVIIIDEFRLLADELPDFLIGLVHIAAVGRSLGVHLVLATQRPAGVVSADIQANVNLRIALRMRDATDSHDVIECDDAARISARLPGRGLARTGGSEPVPFQAARVSVGSRGAHGGVVVIPAGSAPPAAAVVEDGTDLHRIAKACQRAFDASAAPAPHCPWQPALPDTLAVHSLPAEGIGLVDRPRAQRVDTLRWQTDRGHWVVAGGPRSGRTTLVRTVVGSLAGATSPAEQHVYVVDGASALAPLAGLPHVGAVVRADETYRLARLLARLADEVRTRSMTAAGLGVDGLDAWARAYAADPGAGPPPPPPILLVVDGWDRVAATTDPVDHGETTDALVGLLRDGATAGLTALVTGDRSVLLGRVSSLAGVSLVLPLADPNDLAVAGLRRKDVPKHWPPGRAVRVQERAEIQVGHLGRSPAAGDQAAALAQAARGRTAGAGPIRLRPLPARVSLDDLPASDALTIGVGGDEAEPLALDLEATGRQLLVAGPGRSGRTTALATVAVTLSRSGRAVAVVETRGRVLADRLTRLGVMCLGPHDIEPLVAARRESAGLALLVDDADSLDGAPIEPVIREILSLVDRDGGLAVVSATSRALVTQLRGVAVEIARGQSGILLSPKGFGDGEPFGITVPRGFPQLPGRGLLVSGRRPLEIQVATPPGES